MVKMKDNFEMGIFWELYMDLERQFENYLEYVPYLKDTPGGIKPRGNERVYSFKLLNLILSIGGHIDSVFKEMARYKGFKDVDCRTNCTEIKRRIREKENVPVYLPINAFEKEYSLSQRSVIFKCVPQHEVVTPFVPTREGNNVPKWWTYYNGLKHDLSVNLKKANLRNARDVLAGAFVLNVVHIPALFRLLKNKLLKPKIWPVQGTKYQLVGSDPLSKDQLELVTNNSKPNCLVETNLFIYDFDTEPSYK